MNIPAFKVSGRNRRYDIDWIRIFAMLVVFIYHCGRFFNDEDWHVKNPQTSYGITVSLAIVGQWMMPLFFVLSGASSYYALSYQSATRYIRSRINRLVVPLVFGVFVLIAPLEVYLERLSHGEFAGPFWKFYPHYFDGWYGFGGNFAWMGIHLWYLEVLFVNSVLMLPLFIFLRKGIGLALLKRASEVLRAPGFIFLLAVPIAIMEYVVNIPSVEPTLLGTKGFGGWSLLPYLVFFILGYIVAAEAGLSAVLEKQRIVGLMVGIVTTSAGFYIVKSGYNLADWLSASLRALNAWAWLVAVYGFGSRHLSFSNRFLRYANEAVLPFYILHQTVILTIGFYIVRLNLPLAAKFFIISTTSFVTIIAIYDLVISRLNVLRFLFGMKTIRS